jgi:hypothetical protein
MNPKELHIDSAGLLHETPNYVLFYPNLSVSYSTAISGKGPITLVVTAIDSDLSRFHVAVVLLRQLVPVTVTWDGNMG